MVKKDVQTHIQVPLLNNSHHNAVLEPKVTRGSLHQIQSISPSEPLKLWNKKKQQFAHQSNTANTTQNQRRIFSWQKGQKCIWTRSGNYKGSWPTRNWLERKSKHLTVAKRGRCIDPIDSDVIGNGVRLSGELRWVESYGNCEVKITVTLLLWRHKTILITISDKHLNSPAVNI